METDQTEPDEPPATQESPAEFTRRSLPVNLLAAAVCGVLTLWLGDSMPNWPRNNSLALVYILMMPFLAIFPLAGLASLGWAGKTLVRRVAPIGVAPIGVALWFFFAAALLINLFALPAFALGVRTLLAV